MGFMQKDSRGRTKGGAGQISLLSFVLHITAESFLMTRCKRRIESICSSNQILVFGAVYLNVSE